MQTIVAIFSKIAKLSITMAVRNIQLRISAQILHESLLNTHHYAENRLTTGEES